MASEQSLQKQVLGPMPERKRLLCTRMTASRILGQQARAQDALTPSAQIVPPQELSSQTETTHEDKARDDDDEELEEYEEYR